MKYPDAHVEAHVKIEGTAAKPRGNFDIDLDTEMPLLAEAGGRQRVVLTGKVVPTADGSHLKANLGAWLDHRRAKVVNADIRADLKRQGRETGIDWNLGLSVDPPALEALPARIRRPGLTGKVAVRADLQGTRRRRGRTCGGDSQASAPERGRTSGPEYSDRSWRPAHHVGIEASCRGHRRRGTEGHRSASLART